MKTLHLLPLIAAIATLPCVAQNTDTTPAPGAHRHEGRHHRIDRREDSLDRRIDQGIAKGKLTTEQASNLEGKLDQIKQDEAKALQNDGRIDRKEAAQLNREANQLSHEIHQQKHPGKGK